MNLKRDTDSTKFLQEICLETRACWAEAPRVRVDHIGTDSPERGVQKGTIGTNGRIERW